MLFMKYTNSIGINKLYWILWGTIRTILKKALGFRILKLFLFSSIFINSMNTNGQINIGIQKTIGGDYVDEGVSINKLGLGYVTLLQSKSDISSDRNVQLYGVKDYWLVGLNSNLYPTWQKSFGGNAIDIACDMIVTESNDIIIVGLSNSPVSGNKTVSNYGNNSVWIVCTDSIGDVRWQNSYGGYPGENYEVRIIQGLDGAFIIGTSSGSGISGTKTDTCRGNTDYWLFSIDSLGNQLWDKTIGGSGFDILGSIIQISDSNIVVLGTSNSPISGEKSEDTIAMAEDQYDIWGGRDLWLVNYNFIVDTIVWDRTIGGDNEENMNTSLAFVGNYIYLSASTLSGISGTKSCSSFGDSDIWINKVSKEGALIWNKAYGGSGLDLLSSLKVIGSKALLIGGSSSSPISGNKTENPIGATDYWFVTIDSLGSIVWDKTIGGNNIEVLSDMFINDISSFIAVGSSLSSATGHKTETIRGNANITNRKFDAWLIEINITTYIENNSEDIIIYCFPNPTTNHLNIVLQSQNKTITQLQIIDLQGKLIQQKTINSAQAQLNVSKLAKGIYIIEGTTNTGERFSRKFVKE